MSRQSKDWDDIKADYERMVNMSCRPVGKKYPNDYIFDEDRSVKWNREEVERRNNERAENIKELQKSKNKARDEVHEDICYAIQQEVGHDISREAAGNIWNYAYEKGHDFGWNDIKCYLNEIMELISKILDIKF